jgi:hypothetical protein
VKRGFNKPMEMASTKAKGTDFATHSQRRSLFQAIDPAEGVNLRNEPNSPKTTRVSGVGGV